MNSWPEHQRLVALQWLRQQRAQRAWQHSQQQWQALQQALSGFTGQEASLHSLLASHQVSHCTLDRGQLLALLRTQAVIRRQLDLLCVERDHVAGQCRQLEQQLHQQREQLCAAQRRHDTCARRLEQLARMRRLAQLDREERDIEEMSGVRY